MKPEYQDGGPLVSPVPSVPGPPTDLTMVTTSFSYFSKIREVLKGGVCLGKFRIKDTEFG